jgi:hypothetical protein
MGQLLEAPLAVFNIKEFKTRMDTGFPRFQRARALVVDRA